MKLLKVFCFVLTVLAITAQNVWNIKVAKNLSSLKREVQTVKEDLAAYKMASIEKTRDFYFYKNLTSGDLRKIRRDIQMLREAIAENKKATSK
jgi:hypothetical protein